MSRKHQSGRFPGHGDRQDTTRAAGTTTLGMTRRAWIRAAVVAGGAALVAGGSWWKTRGAGGDPALVPITVHLSPTCGCCKEWVAHLETSGFRVTKDVTSDVSPVKAMLGVPDALWSCHTAEVGGYAIEGHVPADLIHRMLRERPAIAGLAVPGMPVGAPGMEQPGPRDRYEILTFTRAGETSVFEVRG
ncbi:MAG: DUF411 domain-containing protein [Gemmatimonadaceae bacterium]